MEASDSVFEEIPVEECLKLLSAHDVGRVAVVVDRHPVILPVNYRIDGDTIVFRTGAGTKLQGAVLGYVAFEVDQIDESLQQGWSVLLQGVGREITDATDARSEQLQLLPLAPWAPGEKSHWIKIVPRIVTGRRLSHGHLE